MGYVLVLLLLAGVWIGVSRYVLELIPVMFVLAFAMSAMGLFITAPARSFR